MKYITYLFVAYLTVLLYFALFNYSDMRFLPIIPIIILLIFYTRPIKNAIIIGVFIGFFMDLHYIYIGPYIIIFTAMILLARWLQTNRFVPNTLTSRIIVSISSLLFYYIFSFFTSLILYGANHFFVSIHMFGVLVANVIFGSIVTVILSFYLTVYSPPRSVYDRKSF